MKMQLKIPPKEALNILRDLIKEGDALYEWLKKDYDSIEENITKEEKKSVLLFNKEKEKEKQKAKKQAELEIRKNQEAIKNEDRIIDIDKNCKTSKSTFARLQKDHKQAIEQLNNTLTAVTKSHFFQHSKPAEKDGRLTINDKESFYIKAINSYREKIQKWLKKVIDELSSISGDYIYFRHFEETKGEVYVEQTNIMTPILGNRVDNKFEDYINLRNYLVAKIEFIQKIYLEIEKDARDPLFYIPERNTICWYNRICELNADSN